MRMNYEREFETTNNVPFSQREVTVLHHRYQMVSFHAEATVVSTDIKGNEKRRLNKRFQIIAVTTDILHRVSIE